MKRLSWLLACAAFACALPADATSIHGTVHIGGKAAVSSFQPTKIAFRASMAVPNQAPAVFHTNAAVYFRPWYTPSDVTSGTLRLGNRNRNGGAGNAVTSNVAVYTSDGSGNPTGTALASASGVTIPGDGTMYTLSVPSVTRGSDGKVVFVFSVPSSTAVAYVDNNTYGSICDSTTTVNPPPSPASCAASPGAVFWAEFDYSTARPRIQDFGDSISIGSSTVSPPGIENAAMYKLAVANDYAVSLWGCNASWMADGNTDANFTSDVIWNNSAVYIEWGTNDIGGGADAPTLEASATTFVGTVRAATSGHVFLQTVAPRNATGTVETARTGYNTWVRANSLGVTGYYDAAAPQASGGIADNTTSSIIYSPYDSGDGLHPSAAGQTQYKNGISPLLP